MYRTKVLNVLNNEFLKPIMDFVGVCKSDDDGCGLLKIVGADKRENGKIVPTYFRNYKTEKIYTIISSQDEFLNYRSRREELDYFNPFVKYKNTLLLLLMTIPVVYDKVTSSAETDDEISDIICDDELVVSKEEVLNKVRVLQYPSILQEDERLLYTYKMEINDNDTIYELESQSCSKVVAILMLIIKIMSHFDECPYIVSDKFGGSFTDLQIYIEELLLKYEKERKLNSKDVKKIKIENTSDIDYQIEEFEDENNVGVLLSGSNDDNVDIDINNGITINLSDRYKDSIPYTCMMGGDDDDDIMKLDLF